MSVSIRLSDEEIQKLYGIYYCKKCGCKIDIQAPHPMLFVEIPVPFHAAYPLCEEHAKELRAVDLSKKGEKYDG